MNENKFWLCLWSLGAGVVSVLIIAVAISGACSDRQVTELIATGTDPIKAHCAIYGGRTGNEAMCALAAQAK